jgi:uncharacterized protein YbjT (DUF2867 family)
VTVTVVVTGGAGELGRAVIAALADRGQPALPASRRTGVDLETGARVRSVLAEAETVVHCASHPLRSRKVDLEGTRRMIDSLRDLGRRPHLIYISIVGVDRIRYPYYRAKYATEIALRRSNLPVTVVRATQFHSLIATLARAFRIGSIAFAPAGFRSQPVDVEAVADRLADLALQPAPSGFTRTPDLAGPAVLRLDDAIALVARHDGRHVPRTIALPSVGGALADFAAGGNLPDSEADVRGGNFSAWLARSPLAG